MPKRNFINYAMWMFYDASIPQWDFRSAPQQWKNLVRNNWEVSMYYALQEAEPITLAWFCLRIGLEDAFEEFYFKKDGLLTKLVEAECAQVSYVCAQNTPYSEPAESAHRIYNQMFSETNKAIRELWDGLYDQIIDRLEEMRA